MGEDPAKKYELDAVERRVALQEKNWEKFDGKLDILIEKTDSRPTNDEVDKKIENAVEKVGLKYDPFIANNRKAFWSIVTACLAVAVQIGIMGLNYFLDKK